MSYKLFLQRKRIGRKRRRKNTEDVENASGCSASGDGESSESVAKDDGKSPEDRAEEVMVALDELLGDREDMEWDDIEVSANFYTHIRGGEDAGQGKRATVLRQMLAVM